MPLTAYAGYGGCRLLATSIHAEPSTRSPPRDQDSRVDDVPRTAPRRMLRCAGCGCAVTDDAQRIYMTYRGVIYTPPAGQGPRYWRTVPIFETESPKYEWLMQAVFVGVSFQVPQRVSYRIFQIL